jgi:hypothetical protein
MVDAVDVAQPLTPQRPSTPASRRHIISERQPYRAARPQMDEMSRTLPNRPLAGWGRNIVGTTCKESSVV